MSSPDELLQQAARMVVDGDKELGAVARTFGVNEKHLGQAVWFMKQNRQGEPDERLQQAAMTVIYRNVEVRTAAASFGVNEEHLRRAVAERKRRTEERDRQTRIAFEQRMREHPPS
jgi:transposase-like protein